jgi:hypothetical protein
LNYFSRFSGLGEQLSRIEQVLGAKILLRPLVSGSKLDTHPIADVPKKAVADRAFESPLPICNHQVFVER